MDQVCASARSCPPFSSALTVEWPNFSSLDEMVAFALRQISQVICSASLAGGQHVSDAAKYVNYALADTPVALMA